MAQEVLFKIKNENLKTKLMAWFRKGAIALIHDDGIYIMYKGTLILKITPQYWCNN